MAGIKERIHKMTQEEDIENFSTILQEAGVEVLKVESDTLFVSFYVCREEGFDLRLVYDLIEDCWHVTSIVTQWSDKDRDVLIYTSEVLHWPQEESCGVGLSSNYRVKGIHVMPMSTETFFKRLSSFNINLL